jgi:hypothetical protein
MTPEELNLHVLTLSSAVTKALENHVPSEYGFALLLVPLVPTRGMDAQLTTNMDARSIASLFREAAQKLEANPPETVR